MSMRIFITHDAPGPQWQLGSPPSDLGAFALIGWEADEVEGGVPERVVNVLARSLAASGRVTFACSTISATDAPGGQGQGRDFIARYRTRSVLGRMAAQFSARAPIDLVLLSTTTEQTVRRLFNDAGYPWWNQAQFALISSAGAPSPDFDKVAFDPARLLQGEWPQSLGGLQPLGVQAILRPGVDGDVAGLSCASREIRDHFEAILSRSAEEFGMSLQYVGETEFAQALSSLGARE
jgi:hypothetical protein